jgi:hypothetical protein
MEGSTLKTIEGTPDFVIIGAQRCGTTSLYHELIKHPQVGAASRKEVHYFDVNYDKGFSWYQSQFPSLWDNNMINGEASPYYLFHPHAPKRMLTAVGGVKIIIMLRNPIDRAYSHYQHEVNMKAESLSFEDAVSAEQERLKGEIERILEDESYYSFAHQHYTYLLRGIYADQLEVWMRLFPKEQMLILKSEDFYREPGATCLRVQEFLGLPTVQNDRPEHHNRLHYDEMNPATRRHLADYFRPHNQRLYELLGTDMGWSGTT